MRLRGGKSGDRYPSVLFISMTFPPVSSPRTIRSLHFLNYLVENGFRVDVVTLNLRQEGVTRADPTLCDKLNPAIQIYRVPSPLRGVVMTPSSQGANSVGGTVRRALYSRVLAMGKTVVTKLAFPDAFVFDVPSVLKQVLMQIRAVRYDFVITSAYPVSTYMLGWIVKLKLPSAKWVMDLGDPWAFNQELMWGRGILKKLTIFVEKLFLSRLDGLVVTNPLTKDLYSTVFGIESESICVIPQGLEAKLYARMNDRQDRRSKPWHCIRFVYTGIFYDRIREPSALYKALRLLPDELKKKIQFEFYGYIPDRFRCDMYDETGRRIVNFHGNVSHEDAIRAQREADVLLLFGNRGRLQIPGKFYEYIAAGRPVLYISQVPDDPIAGVIRKSRIGEVVQAEPGALGRAIEKLVNDWEAGILQKQYRVLKDIDSLSWEGRAGELLEFLGKML